MVVENLHIAFPGANGLFFTNSRLNSSSVHATPLSQKLIFHLFHTSARNRSFFCSRKQKFEFINVLPDGGIDTHSTTGHFLEKEFKFCPMFDEYVKVLESVKADRTRIISEEGNAHVLKKRSVYSSKADSDGEKGNLSKLQKQWSKEKLCSEENIIYSDVAINKSPNAKTDVDKRDGSAWVLVEEILEKKAKELRAQPRRCLLERVKEDLNSVKSARTVLSKKTKGSEKSIRDEFSEKKRTSERSEDPNENLLRLKRLDNLGSYEDEKSGLGHVDNGEPQVTMYQASMDLNVQRIGLPKKIHDTKEVINDELLENKSMSEGRAKVKKEHQNVLRSSDEMSSHNHIRDELGYEDPGKSNHLRRFSYGEPNDDTIVRKSGGTNLSKSVAKCGSSSTHGTMNAIEKPRTDKMVALSMEGNQHNQANIAGDSVLYVPTTESYHRGSNRSNAKFHDNIEAEKLYSRSLISPRRSRRTDVAYHDASEEGDINVVGLGDRAAFKKSVVFTDVNNRPQVSRMEMEERIRNLANWLNASRLNVPEWQFSKMIHSAQIKFSEHSILKIVQILGSFGNWRMVLQVIEWFGSCKRFKYYKGRYIYTTALDVLGKSKRPTEALNIFYAMRQELSSYPDLAAYHCIAVTLGQAGLMRELFDVIDCMRAAPAKKFDLGSLRKWDPCLNPDIVVYNAVLSACFQQKQWEGAFWVLQELKEQGIRPSSTTYGLVMEIMLECGKYNLVYEFFWKLQKNSIPGALNYKVLVNTLWREGKTEEAVRAVKDMERRGIVGCASLYYDLARCLCSSGRCEEALHQINKICKVAKKPVVVTYTGLIQACLDSGSIVNAEYIFNQMNRFCSPNVITCNIMLKSYVHYGMFDAAKSLFEKILSGSHEISRKDESSQKVLPDMYSFNTMMEACIAASKWVDFENVFREMLCHGYHFDEKRHMRLVFDAWRAGRKNILEITWNHLTGNGRMPPPAMIKELFCMKLEEDEPASAISFIVHQDVEIEAFSEKSWLNLLKRKAAYISSRTLTRLLQELVMIISESAQPRPVYQNLLNACKEFDSGFGGMKTRSYCNTELISK